MYLHIFDRSNLDEITAIFSDGKKQTRLEMLRTEPFITRTDIVLMNGTNSGKEYCLYVTPTGYSGDEFLLDVLSEGQFNQVAGIAERMRMNALTYPECQKLLSQKFVS